jgi:FO synthase
MLETTTERLSRGAALASPDKVPSRRLETIRLAGELSIPFTSGILIGIGETREERIDALLALKALGEEHGHVQEVIVQNFRAKPGTRMASHPEPSLDDHLWTIAVARILLGSSWHVQAPPNLAFDDFPRLLDAGIDDWGGVSPVTIDHVNPEARPEVERLPRQRAAEGWTRSRLYRVRRRAPRWATRVRRPARGRRVVPPATTRGRQAVIRSSSGDVAPIGLAAATSWARRASRDSRRAERAQASSLLLTGCGASVR